MANWLQMLVGGLAGGVGAGADYYGKKRLADEEREEREAAIARQQAQWQQTFDAQQEGRDFDRAATTYGMLNPDEDITANPMRKEFERFGFGTKVTAPELAPKVADSLTLPSMPSYGLPPVPPGSPEFGPAAPVGGDTPKLVEQGPVDFTTATPSYGMPTPGKITRSETRQESQQRIGFETRAKAMRALLPQVAPQYRALLQGSIDALERGIEPEITTAQVGQLIQESQPKPPAASAQADFDFNNSFRIANGKPFDDATATEVERQKAVDHMNKTKLEGQRPPQGPAQSLSAGQIQSAYQRGLSRADTRPEIKDYREMSFYIGALDQAMAVAKENGNMIAVDQTLINAFNKLLDPNSVVREAEYARTKNDLSILNRLKGSLGPDGRLALGGAGLTPADREAIARMSRSFAAAAAQKAKAAKEELAIEYDQTETPTGTVGDMLRKAWADRPDEASTAAQQLAGKPERTTWTAPSGSVYAVVNGAAVKVK